MNHRSLTRTRSLRLAGWLGALLLVLTATRATAGPVTAFSYASEAGDYIGAGQSKFYPATGNVFNASRNYDNGVSISVTVSDPIQGAIYWSLDFSAAGNVPLTVGDYVGATRFPFQGPSQPGLSVSGNGRGSNTLKGRFSVKEIVYGSGSLVVSFHATYEQHSEGGAPAMFGEIWYNANSPAALATQLARGKFGDPVSFAFNAGAGASNFFAVGLPNGLSIAPATGIISGTSTQYGSFPAQVGADVAGGQAAGLMAVTITPPVSVTSLSMVSDPGDWIGGGRSYLFSAADGNFTITRYGTNSVYISYQGNGFPNGEWWYLNFAAPSGNTLQPGLYTGATRYPFQGPNQPGLDISGDGRGSNMLTGQFRVNELTFGPDSDVVSFSATFEQHSENAVPALRGNIRYNAQLLITSPGSASGQRGSMFTYQIVANNQPTSFQATGLPLGLSIDPNTGLISGIPTQSGFFNVEIIAIGATGNATITLTLAIGPLPPVITSSSSTTGMASQPFNFQIVIQNNPILIEATGLPLGLSVDPVSATIVGVPRESGTFTVTITAANQIGTAHQTFTLTILPQDNVLTNVSTRLKIQTGDNLMIGGFIIEGLVPKKVMIRAIGPSLSYFTPPIPNLMADPNLEIRDQQGALIVANDDWQNQSGGAAALNEIYASYLAPGDPHEPAVVLTLNPGEYTALVRGNNGTTGTALIEVYDLQPDSSRLANISTRGRVEAGDNVMIGGFIIGGTQSVKVVVRVSGPSLINFNLPAGELLADPTLEIRDVNGILLAYSDNWREGDEAGIAATPFAPGNDLEPAVIMDLPPGPYTAIVRGKNGTMGIGVVEVYRVSP